MTQLFQSTRLKKVTYDAKVAEKEAADKENALSAAKYQAELATYNQAKADYEAALAQYNSDKAKYNAEKANYDNKVAEKVVTENVTLKLKLNIKLS